MNDRKNDLRTESNKKLKFITVYDQLCDMIDHNIYPKGSQLPPENELAKQMGVSRTTLRQALGFLQDDGIVKNIQGRGNFVIGDKSRMESGLETITHPVYKCLEVTVDELEMEFYISASTDYTNKILQKDTAIVVFVSRWYKSAGEYVAYTFTTIPVETISENKIDLNKDHVLKQFLEEEVYTSAKHTKLKISFSEVGNVSAVRHKISDNDQFYLIEEETYCSKEYPAVHNKHYIPIGLGRIELNASSKQI